MPLPLAALAVPALGVAGRALLQSATRTAARMAANRAAQGAVTAGAATGAGVAVNEEVKKRTQVAAQSQSKTVATTDSQTSTRQSCKECPPDCGAPIQRSTAGWSDVSISYQQRIGRLPVSPGLITEWMYQVTFDGFDSSQCHLKEAKAKYDQFFNSSGSPLGFWNGSASILTQAASQYRVITPTPQVRLTWFFMQPKSHRYFTQQFRLLFPTIQTVLQP